MSTCNNQGGSQHISTLHAGGCWWGSRWLLASATALSAWLC